MSETSPTILVVDDDASQRQLLGGFVASLGLRVQEAASGEEALERIETQLPDMVLLDVRLPGISGIDVLAETRKRHPALHVLLITAHADLRQAVAALKSGADEA